MYKLYSVTKSKTNVLGFWKDENGKVFSDKIKIEFYNYDDFKIARKKLFAIGEKAIFYVLEYTYKNNIAYIENENGESKTLRNCITWNEKKLRPQFIKELILQHNGVTIYKNENDFTFEIWKE